MCISEMMKQWYLANLSISWNCYALLIVNYQELQVNNLD